MLEKTNVLLPDWLLERGSIIPERVFMNSVRDYLTKYPDYELVEVNDGFAVCQFEREEKKKKKRRKKT